MVIITYIYIHVYMLWYVTRITTYFLVYEYMHKCEYNGSNHPTATTTNNNKGSNNNYNHTANNTTNDQNTQNGSHLLFCHNNYTKNY